MHVSSIQLAPADRGHTRPDFHGAAIIDAQGREIPITEAMVQQIILMDAELSPLQLVRHFKQRVI